MKFSYSAVWDDVTAMLRSHGSLLLAVAGVFFLLPSLLTGYLLPQPTATTPDGFMSAMSGYYRDHWPWLMLSSIVSTIGSIVIYSLLFNRDGRTVSGAIRAALPILPSYLIMSLISALLIGFGLALFILPGLYLIGRLAVSPAAMVAEGHRNPIRALRDSWAVTRGRGWAVAGLILIVIVVGYVLSFIVTALLGTVFVLIAGRDGIGALLVLILNAAVTAVLLTVLLVLFAAIYRALRGASAATKGT